MTPLLVGYEASSTLAPRTGIGRAALELLRAIVALDDADLALNVTMTSLLRRRGPEHGFLKVAKRVAADRRIGSGTSMVRAWQKGAGPAVEDLVGDVRVFHAPASYVPPARRAKRIVSVYDLAFLDDAPHQREPLAGAYFADTFPRVLPACDLVVTSSDYSRARLVETYGLAPDRVVNVPLGVDSGMFFRETENLVEVARQECGIGAPRYLLAVNGHAPRKRAGLLLDVYEELLRAHPATPDLVVLGWNGKPPAELRARPHLHRRVHVLGHVRDGILAGLYTGAVATVIASSHEGFGFPVLEAQACGSPVVCARVASLPEVGGDAAVYVDTVNPADWAAAIHPVLFEQSARNDRSAAGLANAARFPWESTARRMVELYKALA